MEGGYWGRVCVCEGGRVCEHGGWVLGEGVCVRVGGCVNMEGGYWGRVCV